MYAYVCMYIFMNICVIYECIYTVDWSPNGSQVMDIQMYTNEKNVYRLTYMYMYTYISYIYISYVCIDINMNVRRVLFTIKLLHKCFELLFFLCLTGWVYVFYVECIDI
jgi:hypothetical protein